MMICFENNIEYLVCSCIRNFEILNFRYSCVYLIYVGDMDSGFVFLRRFLDECVYEFEW